MTTRGVTLLETMVALVILGIAGVGYLEMFAGAARSASNARAWSQAVAYAEAAMEQTKLASGGALPAASEPLPGGFFQQVERQPWRNGLIRITVTVTLPGRGGQRYALERLARAP